MTTSMLSKEPVTMNLTRTTNGSVRGWDVSFENPVLNARHTTIRVFAGSAKEAVKSAWVWVPVKWMPAKVEPDFFHDHHDRADIRRYLKSVQTWHKGVYGKQKRERN